MKLFAFQFIVVAMGILLTAIYPIFNATVDYYLNSQYIALMLLLFVPIVVVKQISSIKKLETRPFSLFALCAISAFSSAYLIIAFF